MPPLKPSSSRPGLRWQSGDEDAWVCLARRLLSQFRACLFHYLPRPALDARAVLDGCSGVAERAAVHATAVDEAYDYQDLIARALIVVAFLKPIQRTTGFFVGRIRPWIHHNAPLFDGSIHCGLSRKDLDDR